jgi:CheY-like chemotaxis protein
MHRILFLEDEGDLVQYLPRLLKERDLEVVATSSIPEALKKFEKEHFDAVLLDIMMPPSEDMDAEALDFGRKTGIEVTQRMKKIKPNVPIVAFTVLTDPEIQAQMRKAGVTKICNKPSEVEQINDALRQVIPDKA